MSQNEEKKPSKVKSCLGCGCLVYIILSALTLGIYFFANNAVDAVKKTTFKEMVFTLYHPGNEWSEVSTEKFEKEIFPNLMDSAEKEGGIKIDESLKNILKSYSNISDVKFTDLGALASDANIVEAAFVINPADRIPVKINVGMKFFVTPKSLQKASFTKMRGLYEIDLSDGANSKNLTSQEELAKFITALYSKNDFHEIYNLLMTK